MVAHLVDGSPNPMQPPPYAAPLSDDEKVQVAKDRLLSRQKITEKDKRRKAFGAARSRAKARSKWVEWARALLVAMKRLPPEASLDEAEVDLEKLRAAACGEEGDETKLLMREAERRGLKSDESGVFHFSTTFLNLESIDVDFELLHLKFSYPYPDREYSIGIPVLDRSLVHSRDIPGSREAVSAWSVVFNSGANYPLNNFISGFQVPVSEVVSFRQSRRITRRILALVWCQPTWFEPKGADKYQPLAKYFLADGDYPVAPGAALNSQGGPTLLVPTRVSSGLSALRYGEFGRNGRSGTFDLPVLRFQRLGTDQLILWKPLSTQIVGDQAFCRAQAASLSTAAPEGTRYTVRRHSNQQFQVFRGEVVDAEATLSKHRKQGCPGSGEARLTWGSIYWEENEAGNPLARWTEWYYMEPPERKNWPTTATEAQIRQRSRRRMHGGIDVAGYEGDPVFAMCGGELKKFGGEFQKRELRPWRVEVSKVIYLHAQTNIGSISCDSSPFKNPVKAGDLIALVGRQGFHDSNSSNWANPTHCHIEIFNERGLKDMDPGLVASHASFFPRNNTPKLLPCAARYGGAVNSEVVRCRYLSFGVSQPYQQCWAYNEIDKRCPNRMVLYDRQDHKTRSASDTA
ncbi:M23 family metallopeptidase [Sphingomonas sp.]|uniref:M23 family metallopeptidase n=1 Tax=Sphingomonas sp. TaxID=28214 RepID=UPI002E0DE509